MARKEAERLKLLQNYFKTIFYRDILKPYGIKARDVLDVLMNDFLERYSDVFSITRFDKRLERSAMPGNKPAIAHYLHYLQEPLFVIKDEKFSFSPCPES
nr:hypothetical protein [Desulfobacterales bacterium]